jgi:hypothetical protein
MATQPTAGEARIARTLASLSKKGWRVHGRLPLGHDDGPQHVLVGPDGVVVLNAKDHPRAKVSVTELNIYIDGQKTNFLVEARRHAEGASRLLTDACDVEVQAIPCVLIHHGGMFRANPTVTGQPEGVIVATTWNLRREILKADQHLTPEQVSAIDAAVTAAVAAGFAAPTGEEA